MALGAAEHCLCERAVLMKILTFGIQPQSSPQSTTLPGLSGPTSSGLFFYLPLAYSATQLLCVRLNWFKIKTLGCTIASQPVLSI